jgi:GxxExxY protein
MDLPGMASKIYEELGPGDSEAVYHRAFEVILRQNGIQYETERVVPITFQGCVIGNLRIDLIVANACIIELKAIAKLTDASKIQIKNYLKLTGVPRGILVNFPQTSGSVSPEILQFGEQ